MLSNVCIAPLVAAVYCWPKFSLSSMMTPSTFTASVIFIWCPSKIRLAWASIMVVFLSRIIALVLVRDASILQLFSHVARTSMFPCITSRARSALSPDERTVRSSAYLKLRPNAAHIKYKNIKKYRREN